MNYIHTLKILNLLDIKEQDIEQLYSLIILSEIMDCTDRLKYELFNYSQYSETDYSDHFKHRILAELSWQLCILLCAEYYPIHALRLNTIEDFCEFQIDYCYTNEDDNDFYNFFLNNDLMNLSKREIVEVAYSKLKSRVDSYF